MLKKPVNILLIDDEPESCSLLKQAAAKHRYILDCFHTLEDGMEHLEKNQRIRAVILDSRCALDDEQDPSSIKTNFVFHAMDHINRIEHSQNRHIPFMVYAGHLYDLDKDLDGIAKVISKNEGSDPLFSHLDQVIGILPEVVVREKHEKVFEFINDYLNNDDDDLMETLLMQCEKTDPASVITNISMLRRLLEKLFDVMAPNLLGRMPEKFKGKNTGRTRLIFEELYRKKYLPSALRRTADDLYRFASKYGNHNLTGAHQNYMPGSYAVLAYTNFLLELFIWGSNAIDNLSNQNS